MRSQWSKGDHAWSITYLYDQSLVYCNPECSLEKMVLKAVHVIITEPYNVGSSLKFIINHSLLKLPLPSKKLLSFWCTKNVTVKTPSAIRCRYELTNHLSELRWWKQNCFFPTVYLVCLSPFSSRSPTHIGKVVVLWRSFWNQPSDTNETRREALSPVDSWKGSQWGSGLYSHFIL